MSSRRPKGLSVNFEEKTVQGANYSIDDGGTFKQDGIEISSSGVTMEDDLQELHPEDFEDTKQILGAGSSGVVKLVHHRPTDTSMALKVIHLDVSEGVRKQILTELKTLHRATSCPYIVSYYGAYFSEGSMHIALEYMDGGCLADVIKQQGPIPEDILSPITAHILMGLNYLHKEKKLVHRDIKPSNLLINKRGEVKISDFGESGQLASTLAKKDTWVGTACYMSPERIMGSSYGPDSDLWSLGLSLLECAQARFPYPPDGGDVNKFSFWELVEYIVQEDPPLPPADKFSKEFCEFIELCLIKEPQDRPTCAELLDHDFIKMHAGKADLAAEFLADTAQERSG